MQTVPTVGGLNLTGTHQVFPQKLQAATTLVGSGSGLPLYSVAVTALLGQSLLPQELKQKP